MNNRSYEINYIPPLARYFSENEFQLVSLIYPSWVIIQPPYVSKEAFISWGLGKNIVIKNKSRGRTTGFFIELDNVSYIIKYGVLDVTKFYSERDSDSIFSEDDPDVIIINSAVELYKEYIFGPVYQLMLNGQACSSELLLNENMRDHKILKSLSQYINPQQHVFIITPLYPNFKDLTQIRSGDVINENSLIDVIIGQLFLDCDLNNENIGLIKNNNSDNEYTAVKIDHAKSGLFLPDDFLTFKKMLRVLLDSINQSYRLTLNQKYFEISLRNFIEKFDSQKKTIINVFYNRVSSLIKANVTLCNEMVAYQTGFEDNAWDTLFLEEDIRLMNSFDDKIQFITNEYLKRLNHNVDLGRQLLKEISYCNSFGLTYDFRSLSEFTFNNNSVNSPLLQHSFFNIENAKTNIPMEKAENNITNSY